MDKKNYELLSYGVEEKGGGDGDILQEVSL